MIKRKTGKCPQCLPTSKETVLVNGLCQNHYWQDRHKSKPKKEKESSIAWYRYHIEGNIWICENCRTILHPFSEEVAISCQAHILPKEHFPSVKNVLENHITLGGLHQNCFCHAEYDSSWEKAEKMPVFDLVKERFIKFKHLINASEYKKLPPALHSLL